MGRRGADKGIDGSIYFHDEGGGSKTKQVILSVKAGHTGPDHVRDLRGVVDREQPQIGVLLTLQEPTAPMSSEAAGASFYDSSGWGKKYRRIQILTVRELLQGVSMDMPPLTAVDATFKKAHKAKGKEDVQHEFPLHP